MTDEHITNATICNAVNELIAETKRASSADLKELMQWEQPLHGSFADRLRKCVNFGYLTRKANKEPVNKWDTALYNISPKGKEYIELHSKKIQSYGEYEAPPKKQKTTGDLFAINNNDPIAVIITENERMKQQLKDIRAQLMANLTEQSSNG